MQCFRRLAVWSQLYYTVQLFFQIKYAFWNFIRRSWDYLMISIKQAQEDLARKVKKCQALFKEETAQRKELSEKYHS